MHWQLRVVRQSAGVRHIQGELFAELALRCFSRQQECLKAANVLQPLAFRLRPRFYGKNPETDFAQKSNNWSAPNMMKWSNDEYNQLFESVKSETDVQKAADMWRRMNDVAVNAYIVVPLVARKGSDAKTKGLQGPKPGPFDTFAWNIADWTK